MTVEQISAMQFGRSDNIHELNVETFSDGEVLIEVSDDVETFGYVLTLGQAVQLRDFLNRHIDELALKQTGSQAVRSSDDPTQLAAVEEAPARKGCGEMVNDVAGEIFCGEDASTLCQECGGTLERFNPEKHLF